MKKYGLLVTSPVSSYKNIGDYVQSLAAKQYLDDEFYYVEKEEVSKFCSEEKIKVIMNAWYMWHPENWPPQNCIKPLLTSIHISPLTASDMLSEKGLQYMINHGPVGCRDTDTQKILEKAGVPCYFSGCLTLTLGRSYSFNGERRGIIFVDPYLPPYRYQVNGRNVVFVKNILKGLWYYAKNYKKTKKLLREHDYFHSRFNMISCYQAGMFYHIYSKKFTEEALFSAQYYGHIVPVKENESQESLLQRAEALIRKYSKANLVVTSRIHCALPSIGLSTPVVFVMNKDMESKENMFNAPGRFGGLTSFFRCMRLQNGDFVTDDEVLASQDKISSTFSFYNKDDWKTYAQKLERQCTSFINEQ